MVGDKGGEMHTELKVETFDACPVFVSIPSISSLSSYPLLWLEVND